jgi:hypothetical protein
MQQPQHVGLQGLFARLNTISTSSDSKHSKASDIDMKIGALAELHRTDIARLMGKEYDSTRPLKGTISSVLGDDQSVRQLSESFAVLGVDTTGTIETIATRAAQRADGEKVRVANTPSKVLQKAEEACRLLGNNPADQDALKRFIMYASMRLITGSLTNFKKPQHTVLANIVAAGSVITLETAIQTAAASRQPPQQQGLVPQRVEQLADNDDEEEEEV